MLRIRNLYIQFEYNNRLNHMQAYVGAPTCFPKQPQTKRNRIFHE